jgi:hypothetical protein
VKIGPEASTDVVIFTTDVVTSNRRSVFFFFFFPTKRSYFPADGGFTKLLESPLSTLRCNSEVQRDLSSFFFSVTAVHEAGRLTCCSFLHFPGPSFPRIHWNPPRYCFGEGHRRRNYFLMQKGVPYMIYLPCLMPLKALSVKQHGCSSISLACAIRCCSFIYRA